MANTIPNCISYDPTFAYELAVIIHSGLKRMFEQNESVFYYITVMNENYEHPEMPAGAEEGIIAGMYPLVKSTGKSEALKVQLLGSGTILREVIAAAELLKQDFQIDSDIWSVTSFNLLCRDGLAVERWNRFHPTEKPKEAYITRCLKDTVGPVIATTDYLKAYADQVRAFVPRAYSVLGTDGFGRSDTRAALRRFFEVDRFYIVISALKALVDEGKLKAEVVKRAMQQYQLDAEKPNPLTV
jgi:pyruvate dehydrogenase E1 component